MSELAETRFRCPGENYWIDRPIHLARLAEGYSACRGCAHRFDSGLRPTKAVAVECSVAEAEPRQDSPEGPLGVARNEIDAPLVRQFGAALGAALRDSALGDPALPTGGVPRVAVGADGRWLTAELMAAASEGLGRSGCRVVETGAVTAASLARLVFRHQLAGGLLVGNSCGAGQIVSLKCWGPAGRPWSAGGQLDRVTALLPAAHQRASRCWGGLERIDLGPQYRQELADLFHGLRPLRFVLDTSSLPLNEHLRQLMGSSACQMIGPRLPELGKVARSADRKAQAGVPAAAAGSAQGASAAGYRARRVRRLCRQVPDEGADFGLWIDGDGDCLELIDGRGRPVNAERLLLALVRRLSSEAKLSGVVIEAEASPAVRQQLASSGVHPIASSSNRESIFAAMLRSGAALGGGPSGRLWFGGELPVSDALQAVGELLQLLSQGDQPLSEVLD